MNSLGAIVVYDRGSERRFVGLARSQYVLIIVHRPHAEEINGSFTCSCSLALYVVLHMTTAPVEVRARQRLCLAGFNQVVPAAMPPDPRSHEAAAAASGTMEWGVRSWT
jgi:hypothetical protein